jgi:hypothetical protein
VKITEEPVPGLSQDPVPEPVSAPEEIIVEPIFEPILEPEKKPEISVAKDKAVGFFKKVFMKQKKPLQTQAVPAESAVLDESFFEPLVPKDLKPSFFARLTAPIRALFYERSVKQATGLSTRQRIKRYDASLKGTIDGVQKQSKKSATK